MSNRVIKFRAWNGKFMVSAEYGDWISFDGVPYTEANRKYDTPNIEIEKAKGYALMQFTGLHDSKGVETYYDDIIKDRHGRLAVVFFGENQFHTGVLATSIRYLSNDRTYFLDFKDFEVVGNLHQHPELLKD